MTDTDVTFLPVYHNMDPSRLYVMILTSPPSLPLSRPWAGLGVLWPSQSHPVTVLNHMTGEPILPARTANQYLARYWFAVRAGNQYLARYWFAVRAGKIGSPVM
jgi:hypothetical protein